jgi:hypothetical protein
MTPHATEILTRYAALDRVLVRAGFPPTSPWWWKQIRRFYSSGRRRWVVRAGRRAGKSSTLCRMAYVEARWGKHRVPPGDTGFVMFISKDRDEASQRLRTIDAIAKAVGDQLEVRGDERLFPGRRTGCKVYTASIAGVSGPTAIMVVGDEVALWRDSETGANPAAQVISSASPTMASQREARSVWSSSAQGNDDAHARMFDAGDTAAQLTAFAETWTANPTISEADTHELEPDLRVWARHYAAQPQAGVLGCFSKEDVDRAFLPRDGGVALADPVVLIDAASGGKDTFTFGVAQFEQPLAAGHLSPVFWGTDKDTPTDPRAPASAPAPPFLRLLLVDGVDAAEARRLESAGVVARIAAVARRHGATAVHGDQRDGFPLHSEFKRERLRLVTHDWTASSKPVAVELVRRWFQQGTIVLPAHEKLRRELLNFEERIVNGQFTFAARGSTHDDYVALLVTAALAHLAGGLRWRTPRPPGRRSGGGGDGPTSRATGDAGICPSVFSPTGRGW